VALREDSPKPIRALLHEVLSQRYALPPFLKDTFYRFLPTQFNPSHLGALPTFTYI